LDGVAEPNVSLGEGTLVVAGMVRVIFGGGTAAPPLCITDVVVAIVVTVNPGEILACRELPFPVPKLASHVAPSTIRTSTTAVDIETPINRDPLSHRPMPLSFFASVFSCPSSLS
ncbi:MAG TPA: hypothetical protein VEH58_06170, partial [Dehalococcoidales bacterium]|nr:hypothetical protein [Dehalococcoidales bacterium]